MKYMGGGARLLSFLKLSFLYIGTIDFVNIRIQPLTTGFVTHHYGQLIILTRMTEWTPVSSRSTNYAKAALEKETDKQPQLQAAELIRNKRYVLDLFGQILDMDVVFQKKR